MAQKVCAVQYCYLMVKDRPGEGMKVLKALKKARVNLLAFSGFPGRGKLAQLDFVTEDMQGLKVVARTQKWKLSPVKRGFLVWGEDRIGAVSDIFEKLAAAKINVIASDAVTAGAGRFGMILWVKPSSYAKAKKVLRA